MKINYIANVRMPTEKAHGLQMMKMCEAWAGLGFKITLWTPMRFNHIKVDPFKFYSVKNDFLIRKVFTMDLLPWSKFLGRTAFWTENLSFALFAALSVLFKRKSIVFCRDFWAAYFLSLLGKKIIYEIHDVPNRHFITRHAFKKIWKFVSTNRFKADDLADTFGVERQRILIAHNGVDAEFFNILANKSDCRRMLNLPQNEHITLYAGHLYPWKGAATLLEAAREISKNIIIVFVGGTAEDTARFQTLTNGHKNIRILGHQEYKKIPYFLRAADILILPNTAKEEISLRATSPIKLFEYMTSGKPIIASDLPSVREIADERQVIFVRPDDAYALKQKIEEVAVEYDKFLPIAEMARKEALKYTWRARAQAILTFIST